MLCGCLTGLDLGVWDRCILFNIRGALMMKKFWLLMSFALVLVVGAGGGDGEVGEDEAGQPADEGVHTEESGEEGDDDDSRDTELAKHTYEQSNCISCHGENLSGASGPPLTNVGSEYTEDE